MERTINNKVLLRALEPQERPSLPSNFAYTTMRRIRLERQKSERRQRIVGVCCVLAVTILGIGGLVYMFGQAIWQSMVAISKRPEDLSRGNRHLRQSSRSTSQVKFVAYTCSCNCTYM